MSASYSLFGCDVLFAAAAAPVVDNNNTNNRGFFSAFSKKTTCVSERRFFVLPSRSIRRATNALRSACFLLMGKDNFAHRFCRKIFSVPRTDSTWNPFDQSLLTSWIHRPDKVQTDTTKIGNIAVPKRCTVLNSESMCFLLLCARSSVLT